MKKINLLILAAASFLGLAACGGANNTSATSSKQETTSQTQKTTSESQKTTSETQKTTSESPSTTSEAAATSESETTSEEETSSEEEAKDWDDTSKSKFEECFSGYTIPYVAMGEITYDQTGDDTEGGDIYLDLYGTKKADLALFKVNALALGYSITEHEATEDDPASVDAMYDFVKNNDETYSYSLLITYSANDVSGAGSYMSIYKPGTKGNNSYDSVDDVKDAVHTACSLPDDGTWIDLNRNAENPWYQIDVDTEYLSTDEAMKECSQKYFNLVKVGMIAAEATEEVTPGIDGYEFEFNVTTDEGDVSIYSVVIEGDSETEICQIEFQVQYVVIE